MAPTGSEPLRLVTCSSTDRKKTTTITCVSEAVIDVDVSLVLAPLQSEAPSAPSGSSAGTCLATSSWSL